MNTNLCHRARYKRFRGTHFIESGKVEFEGIIFPSAYWAIEVLKFIDDADTIKSGFVYRGVRGYQLDDGTVVTINPYKQVRTYSTIKAAKTCINILKSRRVF